MQDLYLTVDKSLYKIQATPVAPGEISPEQIASGSLLSSLNQAINVVQSGKAQFTNVDTGYILGLDKGVAKFYIGDATNYLNWTGSALTISGSLTATTITGGTFQTDTSGQRVVITGTDDTLRFYDSVGQVIGIGATVGTAIRIDLNATTTQGVAVFSSTASTVGFRYENSSNVLNSGMILLLSGTTNNTGDALRIDHDGAGGQAIFIDATNAARGIYIQSTSSGDLLSLLASGAGNALYISQSTVDVTALLLEQNTNGRAIDIDDASTSTSTPLVDIQCLRLGDSLFLNKDNSGRVINIDQDVNDGSNTIGISMNIANAGAGVEYAFELLGAEYDGTKTGVSGLTGVIKVLTSDGPGFIPVYDTAS